MLLGSTLFANAPLASFFERVGEHCEVIRGQDFIQKAPESKVTKQAKKTTLPANILYAPRPSVFTPKKDNC